MQYINIIGLLGSSIIGISFIPQTYKIIKSNDIQSISLNFILINIISSGLMVWYGGELKIIPILISNISVCLNNIIILYYYCYLNKVNA